MKKTCHFWWSDSRNFFQEGNYVHPQLKMLEEYKKARSQHLGQMGGQEHQCQQDSSVLPRICTFPLQV